MVKVTTSPSHGDGEDGEGEDEEEKAEFGDVKTTAELFDELEEISLQVSQMGRPLPVGRNLETELEDDADDYDDDEQGVAPGDRPSRISRATRNADTPSANRVLARLGEEMRSESEWMMMFAPVAMAQAKWPVLGPELTQPVNSTDINQLIEDTVPLLKAMGFRSEFPGLESDPSRVLLPKTPETKKGKKEVFRATKRTPYYEDFHMQTLKTLKGRSARYAEFYDAADEAALGGNDSDDGHDYRDGAEDSAKDVIRRLNLDDAERDRSQYLEVRSHASLDKIAEFEGKRIRSDDSPQWLKRFMYEMKEQECPRTRGASPSRCASAELRRVDDGRDHRVTVAATSDDEEEDGMECQPSRRWSQHNYDDNESDYGREAYSDSEGGSDHDYIDAGLADEKSRGRNAREDSTGPQKNSTRTQWSMARPQGSPTVQWNSANQPADTVIRSNRFTDRRDNYGRRGDSRERPQYGPCVACGGQGHSVHFCRKRCKFCQQVHDVGRCELFQRYERLANFVTENVDKSELPDDLQDLYTPSNLNSAVRQH
ncbi:unnamed protein product [Phytophthora fragariaefolia]|uniref:Unnamed protein product n=1 Tax=Phytophthora fragariaefolia TaxID=1490495 RepID=A0A9W6Y9J0_9STRA|nr:unnamed protein product [Phytophthora fragariaefolia]